MTGAAVPGRQTRMLKILSRLQAGGGLNATQLADQLEVCRRTIFRDLSLMREAGVSVYYDGVTDCYRLSPNGDLMVAPTLESHELTTLVAALHFSVLQVVPGCSEILRQSTAKLLSQSSRDMKHSVARLVDSCSVRGLEDYPLQATHVVHRVLQAIGLRRALQIAVGEPGAAKPLRTRLCPYEIIATPESWEVVGRSSHHRDVRTFDPRDIREAELTDEVYAIPRRFKSRS